MSTQKWTKLREKLLLSGLPLEHSVFNEIQKINIRPRGEYIFERDKQYHSVDIAAIKVVRKGEEGFDIMQRVVFDLLIECKTKVENSVWCFSPLKPGDVLKKNSANIIINRLIDTKVYESPDSFNNLPTDIQLCSKGVDIFASEKGAGERTDIIHKAISQVTYGSINRAIERMDYQLRNFLPDQERCFVIIPIIVTNSELCILKKNIAIETIKNSRSKSAVLERVNSLLLCVDLYDSFNFLYENLQLKKQPFLEYTKAKYNENDDGRLSQIWEDFLSAAVPMFFPIRILIVSYDKLNQELNKYLEFFIAEAKSNLQQKQKPVKEVAENGN